MPSVPNWIAKAYIYWPRTGGEGSVAQICEWRATGTQVVVRIRPTGPEYRFRLDGLATAGSSCWPRTTDRSSPSSVPM